MSVLMHKVIGCVYYLQVWDKKKGGRTPITYVYTSFLYISIRMHNLSVNLQN